MQFNRTRNTTKTFIFGIINKAITIFFPFITRTIIIYKLGAEYVGLTSLFTSVLQILNVSELGVSSAISFCLYKPIAENDTDTINALMGLMRKLYKFIGCFILCGGLLILPFLDRFITGAYPEEMNIYLLYVIYLLNSAVSYLGFAYKGILFEAYQEGDVNHNILSVVEIGKYLVQIVILLVFADYYIYAAMLPVSTIIVTVTTELVSRKKHPEVVPGGAVTNEVKNTIKKKVIFLSAHSVAATLTNSIDNIVISGSLGLVATAMYGNYNYITSAVTTLLLIGFRAVKPAVGNSLYTDTESKREEIFNAVQFMTAWSAMWTATCMMCLFQPFIELWVGGDYLLDVSAVVMIVLYYYGNVMKSSISSTFIDPAGLWNKTLFRQIIVAVVNLTLDVLLVKRFGILGIVFASFLATTVIALPLDIKVVYRYVLKRSYRTGIMQTIKYFVEAVAICSITYFICSLIHNGALVSFLIRMVACVIVPNAIMFLISRKSVEFKFVKNHLKNVLRERI